MGKKQKKKEIKTLEKINIIPGTFDPVFKEIFTSPDCHNFVCTLIHHITDIDLEYLKLNLKVVNPNLPKSRAKEKNKPTDVLLSVEGHLINIEMNNGKYYEGLFEKNDMYQHTILSRTMRSGESYKRLKQMIQINIDAFSKFSKDISVFKLMEVDTYEIENEYYIKYHIALPKILERYYNGDVDYLVKLISVLGMRTKEELDRISKGDRVLMEVSKKIEELSLDDIMTDLYDVEKDRQMAEKAKEEYIIEKATKEGLEKGMKEGIKQGIEQGIEKTKRKVVLNMLKENIDIETISKVTGISEEEINNLIK